MANNNNNLTAQQRAQLFAMATRQNWQMLAKQTIGSTPATAQFTLPKARLLSGLYVQVKAKFAAAQTAGFAGLAKSIRRVSLDLNNGFAPFVVSGDELRLYNQVDLNSGFISDAWHEAPNNTTVVANFCLPVTTNPRDPIGLILLQNDQTNVVLNIDFGMPKTEGGFSADPTSIEVNVMTETFSLPASSEAYPDLSVLKLVNGRKDSLPTAGQQIIKLATGTIYRKIIMKLEDSNGAPMELDDITSNIELVFNQADINYSVAPAMLRAINAKQLGVNLGKGVYVFDFSNSGGLPNLGGTRDFIDSANLTEFWVRFTTGKVGKATIVTETLARLS